jgi:hypothetical protein
LPSSAGAIVAWRTQLTSRDAAILARDGAQVTESASRAALLAREMLGITSRIRESAKENLQ